MKKILKIEAFSGASGDMFLGALAGLTDLYEQLKTLPVLLNFENEAKIVITETIKNGIACKQVKVVDLVHKHKPRLLVDVNKIINDSKLSETAKKISTEIFNIIGRAEAEIHGIPIEKIHFHEVGALDSIIDICGTAWLLDNLDFEESYVNTIVTGKGFVKTAHGMLPVPCPAAKLILEGIPYIEGDEDGERLTPTGAAIIKYLNPKFESVPFTDLNSAYGPGEKDFITPNLLRLSLSVIDDNQDDMMIIETNVDDSNSEYLGIEFQNKLLNCGALDFYFTQIIMKKGRPGILLTVVCRNSDFNMITEFILNFTSTIGIRYHSTKRIGLKRSIKKIKTEFGTFRVKVSQNIDGTEKIKPESEDILKYSIDNGITPNIISQKIIEQYKKEK